MPLIHSQHGNAQSTIPIEYSPRDVKFLRLSYFSAAHIPDRLLTVLSHNTRFDFLDEKAGGAIEIRKPKKESHRKRVIKANSSR